jgi:hypothetical protein
MRIIVKNAGDCFGAQVHSPNCSHKKAQRTQKKIDSTFVLYVPLCG